MLAGTTGLVASDFYNHFRHSCREFGKTSLPVTGFGEFFATGFIPKDAGYLCLIPPAPFCKRDLFFEGFLFLFNDPGEGVIDF